MQQPPQVKKEDHLPQSWASSRASSVMTRLESHVSSSWTFECWPHRESQQPHPPPEANCLEEQPHRLKKVALHRRGKPLRPPPHPVATSSYIPSTSTTRGDVGGRSCIFEPGKKWRWAKRNLTMRREMKGVSSKLFFKSLCLMYLDDQVVRPISNLENTWFEINEENKWFCN